VNLSIVIATWNRLASLRRLLVQLAEQTVPAAGYEVVVVDDGSTPKVDLVDLRPPYALRLMRQENAGAASARHAGVLAARGEVVLFLDDDMQVDRDFLEQHLLSRREGDGRAVVLGRIKADPEVAKMPLFERWHSWMLDRKAESIRDGKTALKGNLLFTGNCSLLRADYLAVGGFDPSLPNSEDVELGLRLEKAGVEFRFSEAAWTLHSSDHTSLEKWCRRARRYGTCDHRIAAKHPELRHASPWRFVYELQPKARPFLAAAVLAPRAAAAAAGVAVRLAGWIDRAGFERPALSGTTLAYAMEYFSGVREAAGSTGKALEELLAFAARFENNAPARALADLRADQEVMRQYEAKYGHTTASDGRLGADLVQKIGLQTMAAYRVMRALHASGSTLAAKAVSRLIRHLYGSDIHWEAQFEPGVMLVHGMGLAISREARVARGCILFQHVTLGMGIDPDTRQSGAPTLERNVHVGPGATLIGPITVGEGSKIMAGAVLTRSVPPGSLVETPAPEVRPRISLRRVPAARAG
jgi:serine acetyltransferase/GT2 family glycosyltransferase